MNGRAAATSSQWGVLRFRKTLLLIMAIILGGVAVIVYNNTRAPATTAVTLDPGTPAWFQAEQNGIATNERLIRNITADMSELYTLRADGTWGVAPENQATYDTLLAQYNGFYLAWYDRATYYDQQAVLAERTDRMLGHWTTLQPPGGRTSPVPDERWVIDPATLVNPL